MDDVDLLEFLIDELLENEANNISVSEIQPIAGLTYGIGKNYIRNVYREKIAEIARQRLLEMDDETRNQLKIRSKIRKSSSVLAIPRDLNECPLRVLKREQVLQFFKYGYLILPSLFEREFSLLKDEIDRLKNFDILTTALNNSLDLEKVTTKSRLFRGLVFSNKLRGIIADLIGTPFFLHFDHIFLKPAHSGLGTAWHQDSAYYQIDNNLRGVALWISIDQASKENGTLELIPQSFKHSLRHTSESHPLLQCHPDESKAVLCEVPAGGAVLFAYGMVHCTRKNNSNHERSAVAFHFFHSKYASQDFLKQNSQYRIQIEGPLSSFGVQEYGEDMRNVWETEFSR